MVNLNGTKLQHNEFDELIEEIAQMVSNKTQKFLVSSNQTFTR